MHMKAMVSAVVVLVVGLLQGGQGVRSWALSRDAITLHTFQKPGITVPINSTTTIADVKAAIERKLNISNLSRLLRIDIVRYGLFSSERFADISDDVDIREVMRMCNSDYFELYLHYVGRTSLFGATFEK